MEFSSCLQLTVDLHTITCLFYLIAFDISFAAGSTLSITEDAIVGNFDVCVMITGNGGANELATDVTVSFGLSGKAGKQYEYTASCVYP